MDPYTKDIPLVTHTETRTTKQMDNFIDKCSIYSKFGRDNLIEETKNLYKRREMLAQTTIIE